MSSSFGIAVPLECSSHLHLNVKEAEKFVDVGFSTPPVQCLKVQDVVLPAEHVFETEIKVLVPEGADDQPENVMKRKRGQPNVSGFENENTTHKTGEETLEWQQDQDLNPEHDQVDVSASCMPSLPSDLQQCRRTGKKKWRCSSMASPGKIYCAKHQLEMDIFNKKRRDQRNSSRKKGSRFEMDPLLPSGQHQCRRTGKGWRCSAMASPGKLYCEKHQLYQDLYTIKMREWRRKQKCLVTSGCDVRKYVNNDHPTCLERTREEEVEEEVEKERSVKDIQVQCPRKVSGIKHVNSDRGLMESGATDVRHRNPKRSTQLLSSTVVGQQTFDVHLGKPASPTSKAPNNNLTIEQIDYLQMLSQTLEVHQSQFSCNERSNHPIVEDNKGTEKDAANSDLKIAEIDHRHLLNSTLEEDQAI